MRKFNRKSWSVLFLAFLFISFTNIANVFAVSIPISSCEGLLSMSDLSGVFHLTQDIDCSATSSWNGGLGWLPLGTFTGTLDGGGFAITHLYINRPTSNNVGLFSIINGGNVSDLSFTNANITGNNNIGALAGKIENSATINDISVTGSFTGAHANWWDGSYVGGVSGLALDSTFNDISVQGTVSGNGYAGGLFGLVQNSSFSSVSSSATVAITAEVYVGGLAAQANNSTFNDAHATGSVSGPSFVGGLIGFISASSFDNCSASGNVTGVYNQGNVGGLIASTSGVGTIENCSSSGNVSGGIVAGGLVGTQSVGTTIDSSYASGTVSNSKDGVGGLVGVSNDTITKSYATGNVTGQGNGIGGLVGENYSTVIDSWASGTVTSIAGNGVGGLVGYNDGAGIVRKSYATGGGVSSSVDEVGGLVGANYGTIEKSYSTKNATGNDQVGGLSGNNFGATISNCYATGNVGISGAAGVGGGLVGAIGGDTITNSYSTGSKIASPGTFNGAIGDGSGGSTVSASYWDVQTSGIGASGNNNFGVIGKTTAEMKTLATFAAWNISTGSDFSTPTIWFIGASYPELHYTPGATTTSATSIALTGATLRGSLNYYFGVNGYFQYREVGASIWTSTAPQSLASLGAFTQAITGLTSNTNYEYRTVINYGTGYNYGTVESFQTLKQDPAPTAQAASNVFPTAAKLKGEVTDLGDYSPVEASFRYKKVGDIAWTTTPVESILVAGNIEATITGLTVGTDYEYQLKIVFGGAQEVFGTLTTFQTGYGTTSSASYSTTNPTTTTTTKPASITTKQESLSEEEYNDAHYYIQYKKEGDTQWSTTGKKPMPQDGSIETIINGIQNNTNYEYQYIIETKEGKKIYSQVNKFIGSNSSFTVKSFTLILSSNDVNKGSVAGAGIFYSNQNIAIVAKEKANYKFVGWQEKGNIISQNKEYTFIINEHRNIKAIFAEQTREDLIMTLQIQLISLLNRLLLMLQNR